MDFLKSTKAMLAGSAKDVPDTTVTGDVRRVSLDDVEPD
jgi:hypothetical protein